MELGEVSAKFKSWKRLYQLRRSSYSLSLFNSSFTSGTLEGVKWLDHARRGYIQMMTRDDPINAHSFWPHQFTSFQFSSLELSSIQFKLQLITNWPLTTDHWTLMSGSCSKKISWILKKLELKYEEQKVRGNKQASGIIWLASIAFHWLNHNNNNHWGDWDKQQVNSSHGIELAL